MECIEDGSTKIEIGRVHDTKNNTLLGDTTATGRRSVNTALVSKLFSATCTESDGDGIDQCYSAQLDESCAKNGQVDTGAIPADRLNELREGYDTTTDENESQFEDLDRRFLCALKEIDATGLDGHNEQVD